MADLYREVTRATSVPIHTGEQIYLRQNFRELIETKAVNIIGPDPADIGGLAELKWVAEYADLHGILMAPHGTIDGVIGLAALVHSSAAMPHNYIAFEYPVAIPKWWYEIVDGLPNPIVKNSHIDMAAFNRPGLGVTFNVDKAVAYLKDEDQGFFD
jgi:L-alanine-DL-glutamate epimerase-like enolase superfamily enzyme